MSRLPPRSHGRYYIARMLRERYAAIAERHIRPLSAGRLVDYGCGDMPYRCLLEPAVGRYIGIDLPGNARADACLHPDGTSPIETASADVVISSQVLEHVDDPRLYLAECRRMLRPGGLLVLSTHGHWVYHPHPNDWWRWTGPGLRRTIVSAGFEVIEMAGLMGLAAAGVQLLQDGIARKLPRFLRTPFVTPMQMLAQLADAMYTPEERQRDASVYVIVACRKPSPA